MQTSRLWLFLHIQHLWHTQYPVACSAGLRRPHRQYAALRRVPAKGDLRSNIHASGTAETVEVTDDVIALAEMMRPKLVEDGMFLVGLDIVGDKILEVNVFSPGGLAHIRDLAKVDFTDTIIESIEKKVSMQQASAGMLSNRLLATL